MAPGHPGEWARGLGSPGSGIHFSLQDDLHIVDSLQLPTADPEYLMELARYRRWGDSVLLVDL
jgi:hypothetical protein